ncbi:MAG TPA: redoxin family protein [Gammaproteobacteria bacterium]
MKWQKIILYLVGFLAAFNAIALDMELIPQVGTKAQNSFDFDYIYATEHRAFAIAPGGAWSWKAKLPSVDAAKAAALKGCQEFTQSKCVLYAVNNEIVFNRDEWYQLWGPYKNKKQAAATSIGLKIGDRFPDIAFTDINGKKKSFHDLKGKVVFAHFWGCWCPPCRREFVSLIDMYRILKDTMGDDVEFIVMQLREPIETSRQWAKENSLDALPLADSGVKSSKDTELTLKDGSKIADRQVSRVFPSSYVIDKHGVIVFSHMGSIEDWSEYVPFFHDAVKKSGK